MTLMTYAQGRVLAEQWGEGNLYDSLIEQGKDPEEAIDYLLESEEIKL